MKRKRKSLDRVVRRLALTVKEQPLASKLGHWDESRREIVINESQPDAGKLVTLVHEALHMAETQLIGAGEIKRRMPEKFIAGAAFGVTALLVEMGLMGDMTPNDFWRFARNAKRK